jgi:hypothetical protein
MLSRLRARLTYANVMSTLAAFGVLATGGAYAANEWNGSNIQDGTLTGADIQDLSLGLPDYGANSISTGKLKDQDVRTQDLRDLGVTNSKIAWDSVSSGKVINNNLTSDDLGPNSAGMSELNPLAESNVTPQATGTLVSGGNYIYPGSSFTVPEDGQCLVVVTAQLESAAANNNSGDSYLRTAVNRGATNTQDGTYGFYVPAQTAGFGPVQTRTLLIPVARGQSIKFGAYVNAFGDEVGDAVDVTETHVCF